MNTSPRKDRAVAFLERRIRFHSWILNAPACAARWPPIVRCRQITRRKIQTLTNVYRGRRIVQHLAHLFGNGGESVVEYFYHCRVAALIFLFAFCFAAEQ